MQNGPAGWSGRMVRPDGPAGIIQDLRRGAYTAVRRNHPPLTPGILRLLRGGGYAELRLIGVLYSKNVSRFARSLLRGGGYE